LRSQAIVVRVAVEFRLLRDDPAAPVGFLTRERGDALRGGAADITTPP
jgi:hypothetical protein